MMLIQFSQLLSDEVKADDVAPRVASNGASIDVPQATHPPLSNAKKKLAPPLFLGTERRPPDFNNLTIRAAFIPNSNPNSMMPVACELEYAV
jgi:hypothetical protein